MIKAVAYDGEELASGTDCEEVALAAATRMVAESIEDDVELYNEGELIETLVLIDGWAEDGTPAIAQRRENYDSLGDLWTRFTVVNGQLQRYENSLMD